MNSEKTNTATANEEKPAFVKTIGKTSYRVRVYFNQNSKETISDKIIRLLQNEVNQAPKAPKM